jgi:hypothetical protein
MAESETTFARYPGKLTNQGFMALSLGIISLFTIGSIIVIIFVIIFVIIIII